MPYKITFKTKLGNYHSETFDSLEEAIEFIDKNQLSSNGVKLEPVK